MREDTYATEEQAISAVSALSSDLRRSLDKVMNDTHILSPLTSHQHFLVIKYVDISMLLLFLPSFLPSALVSRLYGFPCFSVTFFLPLYYHSSLVVAETSFARTAYV